MCICKTYSCLMKHIREMLLLCKPIFFPQMIKCVFAAVYNLFLFTKSFCFTKRPPCLNEALPGNRGHLALYSRQECLINTLRPASSWLSLLKFFCRKHRGPSHEGPSNFLNRVPSSALFKHYQYAQSAKFRGGSRGWEI